MAVKWKNITLALLSGVMLFLSAPGPLGFGFWAWIALIPLLIACHATPPRQAAFLGLLCGMVYHTFLLYWVLIVLGTYGHLAWWVSIPALLLLALYMSFYTIFFAAASCRLMQTVSIVWVAPVLWVALDYIRGMLLTGFPWQDLGYSQYKFPLIIQVADLFGHYGVTFIIVMTNATCVAALQIFSRKSFPAHKTILATILTAAVVIATVFAYNFQRYDRMELLAENSDKLAVTVVQGNIPQEEKWIPQYQKQTIDTYISLSKKAIEQQKSSLVIWPETALPFYPLEHPLFPEIVDRLVKPKEIRLLAGAPHRSKLSDDDTPVEYFNSSFLISADGRIIGNYNKQHLVPFGEYIPLRRVISFAAPLVETMGDFSSGKSAQPLSFQNAKIGVLICFESIFPELARKHVTMGANMLANITNDAWFGKSSAPWQHLSMAVLRSVETRRSLARSANTGISGFIDPLGRLVKISPLFEPVFLTEDIPLLTEETFFVRYGHRFGMICLILSGALFIFGQKRLKL